LERVNVITSIYTLSLYRENTLFEQVRVQLRIDWEKVGTRNVRAYVFTYVRV